MNSPPNLLVSEIFPPRTGGSGRWFWEMYRRMPDISIVCAGETLDHFEHPKADALRVFRGPLTLKDWGLLTLPGLQGYWKALRHLRGLIRTERPEMIHCGRCLPEGVMALALKKWLGIPYLCFVHGEDISTARDSREYSWLVERVLNNAVLLVANSSATSRLLTTGWGQPADRVRVLYPGVDAQRFQPCCRNRARRAVLGWDERRVVLTVGRLQKRKGHDQMIRALGQIKKIVPNILYAIVGDGEERGDLVELVRTLRLEKQVQFLGEVADEALISCYQQCDLFVLPNRTVGRDVEGFGMVLLEAQACGRPVVAGASGGTSETMLVPATGRIADCESPESLSDTIVGLISRPDTLECMGAEARKWVVSGFDWPAVVKRARRLFGEAKRLAFG